MPVSGGGRLTRRVSDRDRRLIRARARIACAIEALRGAEGDIWAIRPDLGKVATDRIGSLLWLARELGRELERHDGLETE